MVFAADYPFMDIFWTMVIFFVWVAWIWMLITIFTDVFRRRDISGWGKAAWSLVLLVVPFLSAFVYLIAQHDGMADRAAERMQGERAQVDQYVRSVATNGGAASEIDKAKHLLDDGAINQNEFEALKAKALAA